MGTMRDAMKGAGLVTQEQIDASDEEARRRERILKEQVEKAARDRERRRQERWENEERLKLIRRAIELAETKLGPLKTATRIALFKLPTLNAMLLLGPATIMASLDELIEGCTNNRDYALKKMDEELGLVEKTNGRG